MMPKNISKGLAKAIPASSTVRILDKSEITVAHILKFKSFVRAFGQQYGVTYFTWHNTLTDLLRDFPGTFVTYNDEQTELEMIVFETEGIRYWLRDWLMPKRIVLANMRTVAIRRFIIWEAIMRGYFPDLEIGSDK